MAEEDNTMAFVLVPLAFFTFIGALILMNLEDSKREKKWGGGGGEFQMRHPRKMAHACARAASAHAEDAISTKTIRNKRL
ncbi:hypothetical protein PRIPAC_71967 [Pristionchus pacificus]|uniref:Uncharacterized protein n=1 Tax=Pristionchus pacificus TaxID=54126 RepID=A0A2A6C9D8_PRIPA|nr:hypothetical protein PRIPAC_71967 [Pristionchus pacificus]|eukprot:PDM74673.1 hypothetical protein PRIPAC_42029 [Pristionchus pacificus]